MEYETLCKELDCQADSLTTLWLGFTVLSYRCQGSDLYEPLKGFYNFPKLKRLGLSVHFVFGLSASINYSVDSTREDVGQQKPGATGLELVKWNDASRRRLREFFPPHVEVLSLTGVRHNGVHLLRALCDWISGERPKSLKLIRLEGNIKNAEEMWPGLIKFAVVAESHNIQLCMIHYTGDHLMSRTKSDWEDCDREMWACRGNGKGQDPTTYYDGRGEKTETLMANDIAGYLRRGEKVDEPNQRLRALELRVQAINLVLQGRGLMPSTSLCLDFSESPWPELRQILDDTCASIGRSRFEFCSRNGFHAVPG